VDVPVAGPWRARFEGAAANWRVEGQRYDPDQNFQLVAKDPLGHVAARQFLALIGRQGGRAPVCGYVLAGGGIYSLDYKGAGVTRPGFALTAGIEIPAPRSAVYVDVQLNLIPTRDGYPVQSTAVLAAGLSAGWALRF
jgi:hypothetical protein